MSTWGASQDFNPSVVVQAFQTAETGALTVPSVTMKSSALAGRVQDIRQPRVIRPVRRFMLHSCKKVSGVAQGAEEAVSVGAQRRSDWPNKGEGASTLRTIHAFSSGLAARRVRLG